MKPTAPPANGTGPLGSRNPAMRADTAPSRQPSPERTTSNGSMARKL